MKNNKKTLVSAVQAALVAAGHIPADTEAQSTVGTDTTETALQTETEVTAVTSAEDEGTQDAIEGVDTAVVTNEAPTASINTNVETELTSQVQMFKSQLQEREDQLIDARVEVKTLTKQLEQAETAMEGLKAIAVKSINAMQVALGGSASNFDGATAKDILTRHEQLSDDFTKNFKVGGVASVDVTIEDSPKSAAVDSLRAAKLKAV